MIETVVSANMLIGEVMRVKKNHLAPDFPTGNEKRLCIVSGIHGDEVAGQYICYELIRSIFLPDTMAPLASSSPSFFARSELM